MSGGPEPPYRRISVISPTNEVGVLSRAGKAPSQDVDLLAGRESNVLDNVNVM